MIWGRSFWLRECPSVLFIGDKMEKYCTECGSRLIRRELEGEGEIPYCPKCEQYRFPGFNVAVSMVVVDVKTGKILLIQQYGRPFYILVAGYVNKGENAESAVYREILEETGLKVIDCKFNRTKYFEPSNTLMCNFTAYIEDGDAINVNSEIDAYNWFTREEALKNIKENSLAEEFLRLASCHWGRG